VVDTTLEAFDVGGVYEEFGAMGLEEGDGVCAMLAYDSHITR
jgi:hypothetical protein